MANPAVSEIWKWLDGVPDPEIPVISLVDLGIIRDISWQDDTLCVSVTSTYSACPATTIINRDIEEALRSRGIEKIELKQQLSPCWTTDWLSEKGRKSLEKFGIAPPATPKGPQKCPRCGGFELAEISRFGSTPCKAQWRCSQCLEPFDYFKCF